MKEPPKVKMSVEMGRSFMLLEQPWYDTDMCQSSVGLVEPFKASPASEKIKYTLCRYAVNAYLPRRDLSLADETLAFMWFTHGFAPATFSYDGKSYVALISLRGVCWVDKPPYDMVNPDGGGYETLVDRLNGVRRSLRSMFRDEQAMR